jgi:hypothetical protein
LGLGYAITIYHFFNIITLRTAAILDRGHAICFLHSRHLGSGLTLFPTFFNIITLRAATILAWGTRHLFFYAIAILGLDNPISVFLNIITLRTAAIFFYTAAILDYFPQFFHTSDILRHKLALNFPAILLLLYCTRLPFWTGRHL